MTAQSGSAYVHGMAYKLGRRRLIADLVGSQLSAELADRMHFEGLRHFREEGRPAPEILRSLCGMVIQRSGLDASGVKRILYNTMTFWDYAESFLEQDLLRAIYDTGLTDAELHPFVYPGCVGATRMFDAAAEQVRLRPEENILLATVNRGRPDARSNGRASYCHSDAGAACIVSSVPSDLEILTTAHISCPELAYYDLRDAITAAQYQPVYLERCVNVSIDSALSAAGLSRSEVQVFLTNNYSRTFIARMGSACGLRDDQMFYDNVARTAHSFSGDSLINMCDYATSNRISRSYLMAVVTTAPCTAGCSILRVTRAC